MSVPLKGALSIGISAAVVVVALLGLTLSSASAGPLRIMPLGDSITSGYTNNSWSGNGAFTFGYRGPLYTKLTNAGYDFQFVGASTEPWTPAHIYQDGQWYTSNAAPTSVSGPDLRTVGQDGHRGYWGQRTDWIASNVVSWLNTDNPDIVLLMLGTNNTDLATANLTAEPTTSENQLRDLVQTIVNTKPAAQVVVAQISPRIGANTTTGAVVKYNNYIENTLVPYFQGLGKDVTTVDQYANFVSGGVINTSLFATDSSVHPSTTGYSKIAQTWFDGIHVDVTWTGGVNSTWNPGTGNWKTTSGGAAAPYSDGTDVTFSDSATGTTTANISANVTPSSVVFNNSSKNFTITGASGIGGTATVLKQGTGTVTMSSVNTYSGVTTVEAGKLILSGAAKAMVPVLNNGGANIKGGMLVLDYATEADPVATVKSLLTTSYAAGAWNTGNFQSSTASSSRGLGWNDNTSTSKINVAYTVYGDTNLDGTTNFTDLSKLLSKYGQSGVWADGDANYDGTVNFTDLSKMLSTYGQSVGTLTPSPEPSSIIMLVIAGLVGAWVIRRCGR